MIGRWPADATARCIGLELGARRSGVEYLTNLDTAGGEFVANRPKPYLLLGLAFERKADAPIYWK